MADIVEFGASGFGALYELDGLYLRRIEWQDDFNADAERDFADGDDRRGALTAFFGDNHTLEDLRTLFAAFFDLSGHAYHIARSEFGEIGSAKGSVEFDKFLVHRRENFG